METGSPGKLTPSSMVWAIVLALELDGGGSVGTVAAPHAIFKQTLSQGSCVARRYGDSLGGRLHDLNLRDGSPEPGRVVKEVACFVAMGNSYLIGLQLNADCTRVKNLAASKN